MQAVAAQLDGVNLFLFLCLCWAIWWCGNGKLMQGKCLEPLILVSRQRLVCNLHHTGLLPPPPIGSIKINFDGATFRQGQEVGAGVIGRDGNGAVLAWLSRRYDRVGNAEIAKALAAREAIRLALRRGWRSIIIEGDCASLIRKLQVSDPDFSQIGTVVMDIRMLASSFCSCSFQFVKRACNAAAHYLAQILFG
ncbi:UNVERIFIED_CONTAM: hypothetical protein Slati_2038200 [Sesamum latifolium]|uniref:RNase H type-1 domain-containing protein n=1 Tax=Sesamum latifolium TaxID=2727402 RepID=A0AAW2WN97_9LAMI